MCLLVLSWDTHPRYRLVFAGNRDEFHERPAEALGWWADAPQILAGRDLQAGGTWLGLSRAGRFGVVTNYRDLQRPLEGAPSRGALVTRWLTSSLRLHEFVEQLRGEATRYAGFNLLLSDGESLAYASNRLSEFSRILPPGIYGLSNHLLDTTWPKLERTLKRFRLLVAENEPLIDDLLEMLADRRPTPGHLLPDTGLSHDWELRLSSPFIVDERYGTRCSTVVLATRDGQVRVRERRFDASGRSTGMDEYCIPSVRRVGHAQPA
jgi:uncharacterized protein with NRDE domain